MKVSDTHYYWMDKVTRAQQAKYWTETKSKVFANQIKQAVESSQIYDNNSQFNISEQVELMPIDLVAMGSTEAIYEYAKEEKGTIAVLNFASYKNPGGVSSLDPAHKRNVCVMSLIRGVLTFSGWKIDKEMPILKEDWNYINQFIYVGEE